MEFENEDFKEIDLYETSCVVLNETFMARFNTSISIDNQNGESYLSIDSRLACLDAVINDLTELDVNCILEMKYTNQIGRQENVNHTFRKQFTIRFEPVVFSKINDIQEIE